MKQKKLISKDTVVFKPTTHEYFINDEKYPSVTSILSVIAKPALMYWAVKETVSYLGDNLDKIRNGEIKLTEDNATKLLSEAKKVHEMIKNKAGDIGTQAHKLVEKINKGEVISASEWANIDVRIQNAVDAYRKWKKETGFVPTKPEFIVYSKKHKYAGMMDCLGKINNDLILTDYKTSNAIYPEMLLQVSAYYGAYAEMFPNEKINGAYIVRFGKEDGNFEAKKVEDLEKYYNVFLSAFNIWKWQKEQNHMKTNRLRIK